MSPLGYFLILLPLMFGIGITALIWRELRWLGNTTTRHFTRLLMVAVLWTPLPDAATHTFGAFTFSGWNFLLMLLAWRNQGSGVSLQASQLRLDTVIAVGVVCVLGAIVIVARSWAQLRQLRASAAASTQSPAPR